MRRIAIPGLAVLVAGGVLALLVFGVARNTVNASLDAKLAKGVQPLAPDSRLTLPVLGSGTREDLADLRGKVVVVNVFASWCVPCSAEAPVLEQAQKHIAALGGTVLGVTYLDARPDSEQFVRAHGITYPVVRDVEGDLTHAFGATGVPETYVIDRQGRVAAIRRYQITRTWLDRTLAPLLAQRS
ncbi:MAG TPA: TlpA disulfide reductase family protein [Solirubrobacteraceae bacterium]|jgi:cytochrome c biogenesis protein CcmG/thiol:disulfide interchange protein DsbE|nr:TlpA disulfide reductase family protein [Solirubrobacteraceae bacterium]